MNLDFRAFGIPIRIRVWFLLMAFLLGIVNPDVAGDPTRMVVWIAVLASAILAHELGHAFAAKAYGWEPRVELGFVGLTTFDRRTQVSRGKRMLLVALGPLVGAAIGGMAWSALYHAPIPKTSLAYFTLDSMRLVNLFWGLCNLLPLLPLDGGHLVVEVVSIVSPNKGRRVAAGLSIVICVVVGLFGAAKGMIELSILAVLFAWRNHRIFEASQNGYDLGLGIKPRDLAYIALTRNDANAVVEFSRRALAEARGVEETDEASYLLAWGLFLSSKPSEARAAIASISPERQRDFALEGAIAHDLGELEDALSLFEKALPRATPFIEPRMVHAIVETRRFDEAAMLFEDSIGEKFSVRGIATVQRAAYDAGEDRACIDVGETLFRKTRDASVAFLLACASCRLGLLEEALDWLRRARERGFSRSEILDEEPVLAPLRALPEWPSLRASFDGNPG